MRGLKLIGVIGAILALFAIVVASASATPGFLPAKINSKFSGKSGKATLQVKAGPSITCEKSEVKAKEGEFIDAVMKALFKIDFINCTSAGLPVNSVGDPAKTILVHVEERACTLQQTPTLVVGILFTALPVTIEVPSTKLTLAVSGSFVGLVAPTETEGKEFKLTIEQKEGKQAVAKCLNEAETAQEEPTLLTSIDGAAAVASGEEAKEGVVTFEEAQKFMI